MTNNIKDTQIRSSPQGLSVIMPIGSRAVFLRKKTEKLCSALYLITGHLKDTEPLKSRTRQVGLDVLEVVVRIYNVKDSLVCRWRVVELLEELSGLLYVLNHAGLVSSVNIELIGGQCEAMSSLIVELVTAPDENNNTRTQERKLDGNFFHEDLEDKGSMLDGYYDDGKRGRSVRGESNYTGSYSNSHGIGISETNKPTGRSGSDFIMSSQRRSGRRDTVIDIIKKRGQVNIKEVSELIPSCSEKTIQREVNALIKEGVVERIGKKRWSFYKMTGQVE